MALRALYLLIGKLLLRYKFELSSKGLKQVGQVEENYDRQTNDYDNIAVFIQNRD